MNRARVMVVDDDDDIRQLVQQLLERAGYSVIAAPDGRHALRQIFASPPDVVLLDVSMPDLDGWQTLERIRDVSDMPVMMLTARDAELDKVRGLKSGADDYVTKPFGRQELLARVEALVRRARPGGGAVAERYSDALITIDHGQHAVEVLGHPVQLTPTEFRLLSILTGHANNVLSREQLLEHVWKDPLGTSSDQVKLYIGYLRRKLAAAGAGEPSPIETVRGFGYRYRAARRPRDLSPG